MTPSSIKTSVLLLLKALGTGERWITVHPNGPDTKGVPIIIRENTDGSASVIGGAGGKLNHLRLRGVKSVEHYKSEAKEKSQQAREKKKTEVAAQRKKDKAAGLTNSKAEERTRIKAQVAEENHIYVKEAAKLLGWSDDEISFDEEKHKDLSDKALAEARIRHVRDLVKRADQAVELNRQNLISDAEARDIALTFDPKQPDSISVRDLDPIVGPSTGLGFAPHYKDRAEAAGADESEIKKEVSALRESRIAEMSEGQRTAAIARGDGAKQIKRELEAVRDIDTDKTEKLKLDLLDGQKAAELLRAKKRRDLAAKKAVDALKKVDKAAEEPKAYVLAVSDDEVDKSLTKQAEDDIRTLRTRSFLAEAGKMGNDTPIGRHVAVGAFNSLNSLSLAISGTGIMDRSVVDVIGIAGAAKVLARRLINDLPADEFKKVADAMQEFHLHHYMETSKDALDKAKALKDTAIATDLDPAVTGSDLVAMQELNRKKREALNESARIIGTAAGEMETNAALVEALQEHAADKLEIPMGKATADAVVTQARALGLQRGDYSVDHVAGQYFLNIGAGGLDRLAQPIDRAAIAQVRRNLDIIQGGQDEDDWLPMGFANRPDLCIEAKPGSAPRLAQPFEPGANLQRSIRDYIGGRAADGDAPADILADLQSSDFMRKVGDRTDDYIGALNDVAPLRDQDGNLQRVESLASSFEKMADEFVENRGGKTLPIHRQKFELDQSAVDSLHRALSDEPNGIAAFKPVGELDHKDQRALREFFAREVAHESPAAAQLRQQLDAHESEVPEKETQDMFGETTENPEYSAWKKRRDDLGEQHNASSLTWGKYVDSMRGNEAAYASVQDLIRSKVTNKFADHYNTANPDKALKVGRTVIRNNLSHLDTVDPKAREARQEKERALVDSLRERVAGRYASGAVTDKLNSSREAQAAAEQSQMGFFSSEEIRAGDAAKPLGADERYTLGHQAERQIAAMMGPVGQNFRAGKPLKLWQPSMNGKGIARQRAVKLIDANKRVGLSFGTGTGKTAIGLGAFSHLHEQGKVKRGLFVVPSIVQGQFGGEALRYLESGKYKWHAEPGASFAERLKAYKDPETHFAVVTHQGFRDDMLKLGAQHAGIKRDAMAANVDAMSREQRSEWMKNICKKEGIDFQYLMVDEGHNLLNRQGKKNSSMANVLDSVSDNTDYYVSASADPVKNDLSELHDAFMKLSGGKYMDRDAFMRKYGVDTATSREALKREMARYFYPSKIDPETGADREVVNVKVSDGQRDAIAKVDRLASKLRLSRMAGKVDVAAARELKPEAFEGVADADHEAVARELQQNIGLLKGAAVKRLLNGADGGAKVDAIVKEAQQRKGKPGVVFAHSLEAVAQISARLKAEGFRVVEITGADSSKEKEAKRLQFNPEGGEAPTADIMVASDAASAGMNAQRGQWEFAADTPDTAMTHAQRQGRVYRTGQKHNVELLDFVSDHPTERAARDRLKTKYGLRDLVTSPLESIDDSGIAYYLKQKQVAAEHGNPSLF